MLAQGEFVWIDLESPSAGEVDALGAVLGLHPLVVEDTRVFGQRPKVDRYGDDTFAVLFAAAATADGVAVPVEVHIHATGAFPLTVCQGPVPPLWQLHDHVAADPPRPEDADQLEQLVALRRSTASLRRRLAVQHEEFGELETAVLALPGIEDDARPYRATSVITSLGQQRTRLGRPPCSRR